MSLQIKTLFQPKFLDSDEKVNLDKINNFLDLHPFESQIKFHRNFNEEEILKFDKKPDFTFLKNVKTSTINSSPFLESDDQLQQIFGDSLVLVKPPYQKLKSVFFSLLKKENYDLSNVRLGHVGHSGAASWFLHNYKPKQDGTPKQIFDSRKVLDIANVLNSGDLKLISSAENKILKSFLPKDQNQKPSINCEWRLNPSDLVSILQAYNGSSLPETICKKQAEQIVQIWSFVGGKEFEFSDGTIKEKSILFTVTEPHELKIVFDGDFTKALNVVASLPTPDHQEAVSNFYKAANFSESTQASLILEHFFGVELNSRLKFDLLSNIGERDLSEFENRKITKYPLEPYNHTDLDYPLVLDEFENFQGFFFCNEIPLILAWQKFGMIQDADFVRFHLLSDSIFKEKITFDQIKIRNDEIYPNFVKNPNEYINNKLNRGHCICNELPHIMSYVRYTKNYTLAERLKIYKCPLK